MAEKLKPCPFSGGRADIYSKSYDNAFSDVMNYTQVGCVKCGIFMSTKHYEMHHPNSEKELEQDTQECIEAWNRRAMMCVQKFSGLTLVVGSVIAGVIIGNITFGILTIPVGLLMLFLREPCLVVKNKKKCDTESVRA